MQGSEDYFFRAFFVLEEQDGEGVAAGKQGKGCRLKGIERQRQA
jgi:hypothetical protein